MEPRRGQDQANQADPLARAARSGDRAALEQLWRRHRRWLAVVLAAHAPREADVADLLQEVAVTMVSKIETLHDPEALRPWLRQVAINIARTAGRRRRPALALNEPEDQAAGEESAQARLQRGETHRRIREGMAELPLKYREPLMLRALKDMTYEQIGAVLELPVTTVETRIARARRMMREMLQEAVRPGRAEVPVAAGANG